MVQNTLSEESHFRRAVLDRNLLWLCIELKYYYIRFVDVARDEDVVSILEVPIVRPTCSENSRIVYWQSTAFVEALRNEQ